MPKKKYIYWFYTTDRRNAVVIDWTPEEARRRLLLYEPRTNWEGASYSVLVDTRFTRTSRVIALER